MSHDKKLEESNKSVETKKVYVATSFFSRMSTPGRICRNKEAPVVTNETGRKQKFCPDEEAPVTKNEIGKKHKFYHDKGSSITTLIIETWKSLLRKEKKFKEKPLSRKGNVCRDTEEEVSITTR